MMIFSVVAVVAYILNVRLSLRKSTSPLLTWKIGVGVTVGTPVCVGVTPVGEGVSVGVDVAPILTSLLNCALQFTTSVDPSALIAKHVGVGLGVRVAVGVGVTVTVGVGVAVFVGVAVNVGVGLNVGVGVNVPWHPRSPLISVFK